MSDVKSLCNNAELALAAYADLQEGDTANNIEALTAPAGSGMSLS